MITPDRIDLERGSIRLTVPLTKNCPLSNELLKQTINSGRLTNKNEQTQAENFNLNMDILRNGISNSIYALQRASIYPAQFSPVKYQYTGGIWIIPVFSNIPSNLRASDHNQQLTNINSLREQVIPNPQASLFNSRPLDPNVSNYPFLNQLKTLIPLSQTETDTQNLIIISEIINFHENYNLNNNQLNGELSLIKSRYLASSEHLGSFYEIIFSDIVIDHPFLEIVKNLKSSDLIIKLPNHNQLYYISLPILNDLINRNIVQWDFFQEIDPFMIFQCLMDNTTPNLNGLSDEQIENLTSDFLSNFINWLCYKCEEKHELLNIIESPGLEEIRNFFIKFPYILSPLLNQRLSKFNHTRKEIEKENKKLLPDLDRIKILTDSLPALPRITDRKLINTAKVLLPKCENIFDKKANFSNFTHDLAETALTISIYNLANFNPSAALEIIIQNLNTNISKYKLITDAITQSNSINIINNSTFQLLEQAYSILSKQSSLDYPEYREALLNIQNQMDTFYPIKLFSKSHRDLQKSLKILLKKTGSPRNDINMDIELEDISKDISHISINANSIKSSPSTNEISKLKLNLDANANSSIYGSVSSEIKSNPDSKRKLKVNILTNTEDQNIQQDQETIIIQDGRQYKRVTSKLAQTLKSKRFPPLTCCFQCCIFTVETKFNNNHTCKWSKITKCPESECNYRGMHAPYKCNSSLLTSNFKEKMLKASKESPATDILFTLLETIMDYHSTNSSKTLFVWYLNFYKANLPKFLSEAKFPNNTINEVKNILSNVNIPFIAEAESPFEFLCRISDSFSLQIDLNDLTEAAGALYFDDLNSSPNLVECDFEEIMKIKKFNP